MGEEAATPGQPGRACARFLDSPRQFTLENHRLPLVSAAIIRQAQELSRFTADTLRQIVAPRKTKNLHACAEPVEDEISLWKIEENEDLIPERILSAN